MIPIVDATGQTAYAHLDRVHRLLRPVKRETETMNCSAARVLGGIVLTVAAAAAGWVNAAQRAEDGASGPTVIVDPRIELICVIFRLAGNPEYNQGKVPLYTSDVEEHFGKHRDHAVVRLARKLRGTQGVSFDACMGLAVHVTDAGSLAEKVPLSPLPLTLDKRWTPESARDFLAQTRQFVSDTSFQRFFEDHGKLYDTAVLRMKQVLAEHAHLDWFDEFFGRQAQASFTIQLGMLNGGGCYGVRSMNPDGSVDLFCVLGVWKTDSEGLPVFDADMLPTVVHEFCHSYTNPIVDKHEAALRRAGETLFPHVESIMRRQAYSNWKTMMYESFVRAGVVRYVHRHAGQQAANAEAKRQAELGFAWVGDLSKLLEEYEAKRSEFPDLDAFTPRIVAFFDQYAESFARAQGQLADKRPRILSLTPANGEADVDPALREIRVEFDRPMQDGKWSLVGSGPNFPKVTGKASYDKQSKVWTVPVQLQPDWNYQFMLNSERFTGFQSREGVPLEPATVSFKTRARSE